MGVIRVAVLVGLVASGASWAKEPGTVSPKPSPAFTKTPRKSWSKSGWRDLRWGMGTEDVRLALEPLSAWTEFEHEPDESYLSPSRFVALLSDPIDGCRIGLHAQVADAKLLSVYLYVLECDGDPISDSEGAESAHFKMKRLLDHKYGDAEKSEVTAGVTSSTWRMKDLLIVLVTHPADEEEPKPRVSIRYFDPVAQDAFFKRLWNKVEERKIQEASKL